MNTRSTRSFMAVLACAACLLLTLTASAASPRDITAPSQLSDDGPPCSGASVFPPMGCINGVAVPLKVSAADMLNVQSAEALPVDVNLLASLPTRKVQLHAVRVTVRQPQFYAVMPEGAKLLPSGEHRSGVKVNTLTVTDCDPNVENCDDGHGPSVPPDPWDDGCDTGYCISWGWGFICWVC
jgi:hypothetical protein